MDIHEIFEEAKEKVDDLKFKPNPIPVGAKDVTFEVLDAFFGFATYEGSEGFVAKNQLQQIYGESTEYKIVE